MIATTPTTTAKSIARCMALLTAASIGMIGLQAIPADNDPCWLATFIVTKAMAAAGFYALSKLYERWRHTDKWLKKYDDDCQKALEAPNPLYIDKEE